MIKNLTVYVGDKTTSFRILMNTISPLSVPYNLTDSEDRQIVYLHTTDFAPKYLCDIFFKAKEIVYVEPALWSNAEAEYHTIGWMEFISTYRKVKMLKAGEYGRGAIEYKLTKFNKPKFLDPVAQRASEGPQIWMIGCSFTYGHGLDDINKRFGQLFADNVGLPVSFLTMNGASNQWAADQIFKSDIRPGDIVFWGVTGIARSTIYTKERPWPITVNLLDKSKETVMRTLFVDSRKIAPMRRMISEEFLLSDHSFYESINHIEQVHNYLKKLDVKYLIGYFAELDFPYLDHMGRMMHYIIDKNDPKLFVIRPEYPWADLITRSGNDVDHNDDTTIDLQMVRGVHHPGPRQHKIFADDLLSVYNKLYQ